MPRKRRSNVFRLSTLSAQAARAVAFDGVDEYISIPDDNTLDITQNLSVSFWFKPTAIGGTEYIFSKFHTTADNRSFIIRLEPGGYLISRMYTLGTATPYRQATGSTVFTQDSWYHIVLTYASDDTIKFYVNGVDDSAAQNSSGATTGAIYVSTTDLEIGRFNKGTTYGQFDISDIAIFDTTVLSASDVSKIYSSGRVIDVSRLSLSGNLVSYYKFDANTSLTTTGGVVDKSGSNNGTAINMEQGDLYLATIP